MNLSAENFVSVDEILADVLKTTRDASFKTSSKGWYTSQIQQALEELSFDTFFNTVNQSFPVPKNLRLEIPKGSFNVINIYLYNGDECTPGNSVNVWTKKNFINGKSGTGYLARDTYGNNESRFYSHRSVTSPERDRQGPSQLFYCGFQNGLIMFSENCRSYQNIMIEYNGIMTDIGETPVVPQFFRQAVKHFVLVPALSEKMSDTIGTKEYAHWANMKAETKAEKDKPYTGSWYTAEKRAKNLSTKERKDYKEYYTRFNY